MVQRVDEENLRTGLRIARWVARKSRVGVSYEDRYSAALEGVAQALKTWDPSRGSFASWAVRKARFAILEQARRDDFIDRGSRRALREYDPDVLRERGLHTYSKPLSLNIRHLVDEDVKFLNRNLIDESAEQEFEDVLDRDLVRERLERLTPREKEIILRVYIRGERQTDIADDLGLSHGRVNQIVFAALHKMALETYLVPTSEPRRGYTQKLTPRQIEVLKLYGEGCTAPAIARILGITEWTVRSTNKRIRAKLKAKNTAHAFAIAFRKGIVN